MFRCAAGLGRLSLCSAVVALGLVACLARPAAGQIAPGDTVPSRVYFGGLPLFYQGDYRDSQALFVSGSGTIQTPASRWIDSICYYTMAGETYYQTGQLTAALNSYNSALKLYLAYSSWMMRVQFPLAISPALNANRATPWGQSKRGAQLGMFSETFLMGQGQINNSAAVLQGGVVQNPVLFPVHVAEIVRCTTLAMRRRRELMGPLCKQDSLTNSLVNTLASRPGPPNHWSEAWVDVQLGCAYAAAGDVAQANTMLQRALLVGGTFDHPLTSTALLELGRLAMESGDYPHAATYFEEATYASYNYPNWGNLEEAFRWGLLAHLLLNQKTPYPTLSPAIAWAKTQGYRQLQTSLLLLGAENMLVFGDTAQATNLLGTARVLVGRSDLAVSQLGARLNFLTATTSYQAGNVPAGDQAFSAAMTFQRLGSLWNFQIALADSHYTSGEISSDRTALSLYGTVLREPTAGDWAWSPLECLSMLTTPHDIALEHWFETALKNSKEQELALEISDRARRHRFFCTLPMGGRLTSLRWLLEGPLELLGERGLLERQELLAHYPKYAQLAAEATAIHDRLAAKPFIADAPEGRKEQSTQLATLAGICEAQEVILREIAVRREPAEMVFPPLRTTKEIQESLPEGQVLLSFFATSRHMYAFLYAHDKYAAWQIHSPAQLQKQVTNLLREMGNFDSNHEITLAELAKGSWRATASKVISLLLEKSSVDLAGNFDEIAIVPDGFLWYLPFEALSLGKAAHDKPLIARARVRYAPTVGLAVPYGHGRKQKSTIGVVVGKLHPQDDDAAASTAFEELGRVVTGVVSLPHALPASSALMRSLLDGLIVLDDVKLTDGPYDWSPAQVDRGRAGSSLESWFSLPWGGPETVILPGFHTAAENALRRGQPTGEEMFLSLCGLMSAGTRTILISRWRTGGQTSFDLVREFAQELPHATPAEAWQRSVRVACENPLEADHEPRVKKATAGGEPVTADHPLFWAGYMLVDSGVAAPGENKDLSLPGLNAPKKAIPAQPANPPMAAGVPLPALDRAPPADPPAAITRGKKTKSPPRPAPKKTPLRKRPVPSDDDDQ